MDESFPKRMLGKLLIIIAALSVKSNRAGTQEVFLLEIFLITLHVVD